VHKLESHTARIAQALRLLRPGEAIVVLNSAPHRCDAIILRSGVIEPVRLGITGSQLSELVEPLYKALRNAEEAAAALAKQRDVALRVKSMSETDDYEVRYEYEELRDRYHSALEAADERVVEALSQAWRTIGLPVLDLLRSREVKYWSPPRPGRIWWCPVGGFNGIPIHAAGSSVAQDWLLDHAVSSYTPSIAAWFTARTEPRVSSGEDKMVLVLASEEAGYEVLAGAESELAVVREAFGRDSVIVLRGSLATRHEVLKATRATRFFHYAGHGVSDFFDPASGGVVLADGPLTFDDVLGGAGPGDMAFLSACRTADVERIVVDEVLHPAVAWLYRGYRNVIGTIWSVLDSAPADIASSLYAEMHNAGLATNELPIARMLNDTLRRVRDRGVAPIHWAGFIHMGT
jgi:CHAT domain-containing protein